MNLWHLFQKLRPFVRPYRMLVIATLILTLIGSFTAQVNALTLQYAVDSINALIEAGQGLAAGWHILHHDFSHFTGQKKSVMPLRAIWTEVLR